MTGRSRKRHAAQPAAELIYEDREISEKAYRSLEMTDNLSPELRACVHE